VSFQQDEEEDEDISSHKSYESQGKPDIELQKEEEQPRGAILEDDQNGQENSRSMEGEEAIINICSGKDSEGRQSIIVVEEKVSGTM
jgi:hypothetical protein